MVLFVAHPLVSVMLPVRNASHTLEAAVRSCLDQTLSDLELLLITNQSDAKTIAIATRLAKEDQRIRHLDAPGFFEALELGWREARAPFLARMDSDDLSAPDRLEKQASFLSEHSEIHACSSLVEISRRNQAGEIVEAREGYVLFEEWLNSVTTAEEIRAARFIDSPIANPSAMIRRSVFEEIGGYRDLPWAEDYDFWLRMMEAGLDIAKVPETLVTWLDGNSRLTRNHDRYAQERFTEAKAHFLARNPLVKERGVAICGAGPIGKLLAQSLLAAGTEVAAFVEVSEKRIGNQIHGIPVVGADWLQKGPDHIVLGAVGLRGARQRIRDLVAPIGYREGEDFFLTA